MSDNLKVAKECGAITNEYAAVFTATELDAYTSRILASQQAAHEAEIAELKEEIRNWTDGYALLLNKNSELENDLFVANASISVKQKVMSKFKAKLSAFKSEFVAKGTIVEADLQVQLSAANAACAMKDEALKDLHYALYGNGTGSPKIEAALTATPQQVSEWERKQLAEAEQRGAVKAHQEYMVMGALHNYAFYPYPPFPEGSKLLYDRATSKKAG